jgi:HEAT repeats
MQEDAVEVSFCDLCGTSIPVGDLGNGRALRHQGKTLGSCCLPALRGALVVGGANPGGGTAVPSAVPASTASRSSGDGRLMAVAVVLLAAIAAATIFLDQKLTGADAHWRTSQDELRQAQRSDSDVLQAIGVAMDGAARRADVDTLAARFTDSIAGQQQRDESVQQKLAVLQSELATLRQEFRAASSQAIDYRPLFEDLRQRQQRLGEALQAVQSMPAPAAPVAAPTPAAGEPVGDAAPEPALPDALATQVKKLKSTDPAVRFEATDELLRSRNVQVLPYLLPVAADADAYVRRLAVDGLRDWKHAEVVEVLLTALADADENVRDTAWVSLKQVTGQKLPFETTASKDARARAIQRWREWWDKNKAGFGS